MSIYATLAADILVAILLVATIVSSLRLSRRIAGLKADETAFRQTIGDLVMATASAERAITGLRAALVDCDRTLAERLDNAERSCVDLAAHVKAGDGVIARIGAIVTQSQNTRSQAVPSQSVQSQAAREQAARGQMVASEVGTQERAAPVLVATTIRPAAPAPVERERVENGPSPSRAVVSNGDRIGAALAAAQAISERALDRIRARAA